MAKRKQASKKVGKAKSKPARAKTMAKASKKVVKLVKKSGNGNGLPRPSSKPWGQAGRALDGVRILDFTHVQSGPTCTQLLARDVPGARALHLDDIRAEPGQQLRAGRS